MFKIMNNLAPQYLSKFFTQRESHSDTRSKNNLHIKVPKTEYKKKVLATEVRVCGIVSATNLWKCNVVFILFSLDHFLNYIVVLFSDLNVCL